MSLSFGFSGYLAFEAGALFALLLDEKEEEWGKVISALCLLNAKSTAKDTARKTMLSDYKIKKIRTRYSDFIKYKHWEVVLPLLPKLAESALEERSMMQKPGEPKERKRVRFIAFLKQLNF